MSQKIAGSVAFVTGANRGIGKALVEALLDGGAAKVYAAARSLASLQPLVAAGGVRVIPVELDITNAAQLSAAVAKAGDVTLLINNAGILEQFGLSFMDTTAEPARREMEVNVFGTMAVTQQFAPVLAQNGGGTIVNLSSLAAVVNFPICIAYSFSKAALHSVTQAARLALTAQRTTVIGVYPGPVDTDMATNVPFEKATPRSVADDILAGVEAGTEDVFPDPMSKQMGQLYMTDPKGIERAVAAMVG
jgi:NAD(P)-dependent dehydrogenase (short-subunit alcohol dehydrogenase family)